jgi:hypothetical protein
MDQKSKIREELRKLYGSFETILEHQYEDAITERLSFGTYEKRHEWATYNQVVLEFKNTLRNMLKVQELQYRLTEALNPKEVVIEVLEDTVVFTPELERLYYKIKSF